MTTLGVMERLKEVIKQQSDIIYDMALEMERSKETGCYITDDVVKKIIEVAEKMKLCTE